jgi:hypothetical protein
MYLSKQKERVVMNECVSDVIDGLNKIVEICDDLYHVCDFVDDYLNGVENQAKFMVDIIKSSGDMVYRYEKYYLESAKNKSGGDRYNLGCENVIEYVFGYCGIEYIFEGYPNKEDIRRISYEDSLLRYA